MTLEDLDRIVAGGPAQPIRLDAYPRVFNAGDHVTLEPVGPEFPEPVEDLVHYLLDLRYPGVLFDLPAEVPAFHETADEPVYVAPA